MVTFSVPTTRLAFSDRDLVRVVEPGEVELWVGPSCAERETEARTDAHRPGPPGRRGQPALDHGVGHRLSRREVVVRAGRGRRPRCTRTLLTCRKTLDPPIGGPCSRSSITMSITMSERPAPSRRPVPALSQHVNDDLRGPRHGNRAHREVDRWRSPPRQHCSPPAEAPADDAGGSDGEPVTLTWWHNGIDEPLNSYFERVALGLRGRPPERHDRERAHPERGAQGQARRRPGDGGLPGHLPAVGRRADGRAGGRRRRCST